VNTKVECLRLLKDYLISKSESLGVPKESVDPLVDELDKILNMIPYVRSGDIIQPEHHNYIVDALRKVRDLLAKMEEYYISLINYLATISPSAGLGVGFGFTTYPDMPTPPSLPYVGAGLLTVDVSYDYGYVSPCTSLTVEIPIYKPGQYVSDGVS
jgi:hypothetical protein